MSTGVSISLSEDWTLLPDATRATARARRAERRRTAESRSPSRGRAASRARSPLRNSRASTPLASSSSRPRESSPATEPDGSREARPAEEDETEEAEPSGLIRGLVTLNLNKPSRIRKITVRLKGTSRTDWPEGIGPRRVEISDDQVLYRKTFPVYSASAAAASSMRRATSFEALASLDQADDERLSRRDQHLRNTRNVNARAASMMPSRNFSSGGSYIGARDAASLPPWSDAPPSFSESLSPFSSPGLVTVSPQASTSELVQTPSRPTASRSTTASDEQTLRGQFSPSRSPALRANGTESEASEHLADGASSAPVPGTARSSFELPDRDPTPPARPTFTSHQSSARPARSQSRDASQSRFSLSSLLKGKERAESQTREGSSRGSRSRGRPVNLKAIKDALTATADSTRSPADSEDDDDPNGEQWREFKAGRYVWPIQIPIPVTLPPSIRATFGSIVYTLKVTVVRQGALTPNLSHETKVELVSSPGTEDTEETDSIVIERLWEYQMRYLITLSGKAFPVGSQIPLSIRINPMAKVKLYRITASIEEKVSYFAHGRRIARHEGIKKYVLAKTEHPAPAEGELPTPLLPVLSDDVGVLVDSPLSSWVINATSNDEHAPRLLDPVGPWELETLLQIPDCKSRVHFSIKHPRSCIEATHVFKLVMRVERGDRDFLDAKGNPKKFDIVIECPIVLLSCRNTSNVLPPYSSNGAPPASISRNAECGCLTTASQDALARQRQFARLVSGAESPSGEIPPAYEASPARSSPNGRADSGSRSASRGRRPSVGRVSLPRPPS